MGNTMASCGSNWPITSLCCAPKPCKARGGTARHRGSLGLGLGAMSPASDRRRRVVPKPSGHSPLKAPVVPKAKHAAKLHEIQAVDRQAYLDEVRIQNGVLSVFPFLPPSLGALLRA